MARYTKQLHFLRNGEIRDVQLYTSLSDVVDANVINADGTTGGISLYTSTDDVDYPYLRLMEGNTPVYATLEELTASNTTETGLKVSANGRSYVVVNSIKKPIGVCYFQQDGAWVWRRVDENGNPLPSSPNFNNIFPWKGVESVEIDGQAMVKIPKFYVKADTIASGPYAGAKARWVSAEKLDGYHVHPAFVRDGFVMDCFYIGAYEASLDPNDNIIGSLANATPKADVYCKSWKSYAENRNTNANNPAKRGWTVQDIYHVAAVNYLLLIELETPDAQTAIGAGNVTSGSYVLTGKSNAIYRGIHEWWGNYYEYFYGKYCKISSSGGTTTYLSNTRDTTIKPDGYGIYIWEAAPPDGPVYAGGPFITSYKLGLDANDFFMPSTNASYENSFTKDKVAGTASGSNATYTVVRGGNCSSGSEAGAFCTSLTGWSSDSASRIAKDGELTSEAAPYR